MGRKVHPYGFRIGIVNDWRARWFADKDKSYREQLLEDIEIRELIYEQMRNAAIAAVDIERFPNQISVTIHTARPGIVIGRKGAIVNALRQRLEDRTGKHVRLDVQEIRDPDLQAKLVAESIAEQLERRVSFRRAVRQGMQRAMRAGAEGVMVRVSGRLSGADMGRTETMREGRIPRNTLRAEIDFGQAEALTTFGLIGVKVWIYRGEVMPEGVGPRRVEAETEPAQA
ncbi:MAG: 30S ribosomal protein S3 [Anaerolineae bacterium]|nr:30S ribosomal protein S3 [Anaerolineae bacterium]